MYLHTLDINTFVVFSQTRCVDAIVYGRGEWPNHFMLGPSCWACNTNRQSQLANSRGTVNEFAFTAVLYLVTEPGGVIQSRRRRLENGGLSPF